MAARWRFWDIECLDSHYLTAQFNEDKTALHPQPVGKDRGFDHLKLSAIKLPKAVLKLIEQANSERDGKSCGRGRSLRTRALACEKPFRRPGEKGKGTETTTLGQKFLGSEYLYEESFPSLSSKPKETAATAVFQSKATSKLPRFPTGVSTNTTPKATLPSYSAWPTMKESNTSSKNEGRSSKCGSPLKKGVEIVSHKWMQPHKDKPGFWVAKTVSVNQPTEFQNHKEQMSPRSSSPMNLSSSRLPSQESLIKDPVDSSSSWRTVQVKSTIEKSSWVPKDTVKNDLTTIESIRDSSSSINPSNSSCSSFGQKKSTIEKSSPWVPKGFIKHDPITKEESKKSSFSSSNAVFSSKIENDNPTRRNVSYNTIKFPESKSQGSPFDDGRIVEDSLTSEDDDRVDKLKNIDVFCDKETRGIAAHVVEDWELDLVDVPELVQDKTSDRTNINWKRKDTNENELEEIKTQNESTTTNAGEACTTESQSDATRSIDNAGVSSAIEGNPQSTEIWLDDARDSSSSSIEESFVPSTDQAQSETLNCKTDDVLEGMHSDGSNVIAIGDVMVNEAAEPEDNLTTPPLSSDLLADVERNYTCETTEYEHVVESWETLDEEDRESTENISDDDIEAPQLDTGVSSHNDVTISENSEDSMATGGTETRQTKNRSLIDEDVAVTCQSPCSENQAFDDSEIKHDDFKIDEEPQADLVQEGNNLATTDGTKIHQTENHSHADDDIITCQSHYSAEFVYSDSQPNALNNICEELTVDLVQEELFDSHIENHSATGGTEIHHVEDYHSNVDTDLVTTCQSICSEKRGQDSNSQPESPCLENQSHSDDSNSESEALDIGKEDLVQEEFDSHPSEEGHDSAINQVTDSNPDSDEPSCLVNTDQQNLSDVMLDNSSSLCDVVVSDNIELSPKIEVIPDMIEVSPDSNYLTIEKMDEIIHDDNQESLPTHCESCDEPCSLENVFEWSHDDTKAKENVEPNLLISQEDDQKTSNHDNQEINNLEENSNPNSGVHFEDTLSNEDILLDNSKAILGENRDDDSLTKGGQKWTHRLTDIANNSLKRVWQIVSTRSSPHEEGPSGSLNSEDRLTVEQHHFQKTACNAPENVTEIEDQLVTISPETPSKILSDSKDKSESQLITEKDNSKLETTFNVEHQLTTISQKNTPKILSESKDNSDDQFAVEEDYFHDIASNVEQQSTTISLENDSEIEDQLRTISPENLSEKLSKSELENVLLSKEIPSDNVYQHPVLNSDIDDHDIECSMVTEISKTDSTEKIMELNTEDMTEESDPELYDDPCDVLLENLTSSFSEEGVLEIIEPYGTALSITFIQDNGTTKACVVRMSDSVCAEWLVLSLDGLEIDGNRMHIKLRN